MAMIRRLLLTATQYKYPLVRAPIILITRQYSLSAIEDLADKHKKFFKNSLGVDVNEKEKASLKNIHKFVDLFSKEKTFDPKDVKAFRDSLIKLVKLFGFTNGKELSFEEYFEGLQACLQNDKSTVMSLSDAVSAATFNCLDSNKDGLISYDEWLIHMRLLNFDSTEDTRQMFDALDVNGDGMLSWEDFLPVTRAFWFNVPVATTTDIVYGPTNLNKST